MCSTQGFRYVVQHRGLRPVHNYQLLALSILLGPGLTDDFTPMPAATKTMAIRMDRHFQLRDSRESTVRNEVASENSLSVSFSWRGVHTGLPLFLKSNFSRSANALERAMNERRPLLYWTDGA